MITLYSGVNISIMLPTRKRVALLKRSLESILSTVSDITNIEILFAVDDDDVETLEYINNIVIPEFNARNIIAKIFIMQRMGYNKLHHYYNYLAYNSMGKWLLLWNDDAIMCDNGWDLEIMKYDGQFKLLRFQENHFDHPNALFPCVPRDWVMLFDRLSDVPEIDSWVSQICYLNDIVENIQSKIFHDRHDITNNNYDEVVRDKLSSFNESDDSDISSMVHPKMLELKVQWAAKVSWYLEKTNQNNGWFAKFILDKNFDAWSKFKIADKHNQCYVK